MSFILKNNEHLGHFLTKITKNGPNAQKWLEEGSPWPLIVPIPVAVEVAVGVAVKVAMDSVALGQISVVHYKSGKMARKKSVQKKNIKQ